MSETTEPSFEELQRELAAAVARLEQGDVPVDEAIALWRRGEELIASASLGSRQRSCRSKELTAPDPPS